MNIVHVLNLLKESLMSLYSLKPKFQSLLRPCVTMLARKGVTANQVTLFATGMSLCVGGALYKWASYRYIWILLPIWLFIRMALNAVDGMLAREHSQKSMLGAYLNELGDIVSDTALYLPFICLPFFSPTPFLIIIFLSILTEFVGVMGPMIGVVRLYNGPFGKSDRAFVFGILATLVCFIPVFPNWFFYIQYILITLLLLTILNRIKSGIDNAQENS